MLLCVIVLFNNVLNLKIFYKKGEFYVAKRNVPLIFQLLTIKKYLLVSIIFALVVEWQTRQTQNLLSVGM